MKRNIKRLLTCFVLVSLLLFLSSCGFFSSRLRSVGRTNTTVIKMYNQIKDHFEQSDKSGYLLYGVEMSLDAQGIGSAVLVYTNKRPDDIQYNDIYLAEVDCRTGAVTKMGTPDYATYGDSPYKLIEKGVPLSLESWKVDSDAAQKTALSAHMSENGFEYNYMKLCATVVDTVEAYVIEHISLVNNMVYTTVVDAVTGDIIQKSTDELE